MFGTPTRNRIDERRAATRREIVDAAWALARERGLGQMTLRDVAERVGMRPPSLYTHVASKAAIYDAMFHDAWTQCLAVLEEAARDLPPDPRGQLRLVARTYVEFGVDDLARHQVMDVRVLPDYTPSEEAYAPSLQVMARLLGLMEGMGITDQEQVDLFVATIGGLVAAQHANDPGGTRYRRLVDRAVDMYADAVGLPASPEDGADR